MHGICAVGFDLFNTLITVEPEIMANAMDQLIGSLKRNGFCPDEPVFKKAYRQAALQFIEDSRQTGRETHNRFWICKALNAQGYDTDPGDERIAATVEDYFSAFFDKCRVIPGTLEMLAFLKGSHRLGLLSNFTHAPAARQIMDRLGLTPFFDALIISGEIGFRKPHPLVFERLLSELEVEACQLVFVGDDADSDIFGARNAGIQPVWITYTQDNNLQVQGLHSSDAEIPDETVPRISGWDDLLSILLANPRPPRSCAGSGPDNRPAPSRF